jgi:hypothetical protein
MRYFFLLIAASFISGCAQSASMPASGTLGNSSIQPPFCKCESGPSIKKVSKITTKQYHKIVISGSGFGTMQPYDGDSKYLQILDNTGGWSAGYISSSQDDTVTLDVTAWTDKKITLEGFTGGYGESYWILHKGDQLQINVWNAQTRSGPATIDATVK